VGLSSQPRLAGGREASASSGVAFRASVMALAGGRLGGLDLGWLIGVVPFKYWIMTIGGVTP